MLELILHHFNNEFMQPSVPKQKKLNLQPCVFLNIFLNVLFMLHDRIMFHDLNGDILGLGLASAENHSYQIILVID